MRWFMRIRIQRLNDFRWNCIFVIKSWNPIPGHLVIWLWRFWLIIFACLMVLPLRYFLQYAMSAWVWVQVEISVYECILLARKLHSNAPFYTQHVLALQEWTQMGSFGNDEMIKATDDTLFVFRGNHSFPMFRPSCEIAKQLSRKLKSSKPRKGEKRMLFQKCACLMCVFQTNLFPAYL